MQISYGVGDMEYNERLMHVAEAVARGFVEAAIPGRYLVNTLPFLKYVPAWFPGAGWRRRLKKLTAINDRLLSEPFEDAKVRAVRQSLHIATLSMESDQDTSRPRGFRVTIQISSTP